MELRYTLPVPTSSMRYAHNWATSLMLSGVAEVKSPIKQMAGEEVVMRQDFLDSYSTFPGYLSIPAWQLRVLWVWWCIGCCIRFGVNDRVTLW